MKIQTALVATTLTALFLAGTAFTQNPPGGDVPNYFQEPGQDPPSRVARLNWLSGNVSFQPAGVENWTDASLNYPLTTGDHIYTDTGSRAEMHIGPNAIRLNGQSNFGFLNLDDRTVQVRFTEGALEIRLRNLEDDDIYEVDTPQAAISLLRTGDYRIDTDPVRNATMITVFSGEADVAANGRSFIVHARQTAYLSEGFEPDIRAANPPDDFDAFTRDRNLREDRIPAPVHVSESMAGYEDLNEYGDWSQNPDYGWVWAPRVRAGWAPYHEGRWAWVEPWGWTWIDEAPWGFAPFHYGRWAYAGAGWVWVPGAVVPRPVYAPALVVFVGGPRFTLSLAVGGGGAVGWFPLGPREPFYPAYRVSNVYVRRVNVTHVTNINVTNINITNYRYANREVPGAVVAMPQQGFVNARPVREFGQQRVASQQLAQAQVLGTAPQVAPRRESVVGLPQNRRIAAPAESVMSRAVVARTAAPPPPVSFEVRQRAIETNQGRPLAQDQLNQLRQQPGAVMRRPDIRAVAPVRGDQAPPAAPQGGFARPAERPVDRARDRFETRPPNVSPSNPIPASPRQEMQRPEVQRPEVQRPEVQRPEVQRPEVQRPDLQQRPQFRQPDIARPQTPRPETARPLEQSVRPEIARPEAPRPQMNRPEVPRPAPEPRPAAERPENRPAAPVVREQRAEPAPRREERPALREQKREEKKEEKKDK